MSYVSTVLADGAVGLYTLGDASGTTAVDSSSNANNGTYVGGATLAQPGFPAGGTSVLLSGSTAKITIPDLAAQRITDTFSLEIWLKIKTAPSAVMSLLGGILTGTGNIGMSATGALDLQKAATSVMCTATVSDSDTTAWHHFVATKTGATVHLYMDGTDVTGTLTNATCVETTSGFFIGTQPHSNVIGYHQMAAWYTTVLTSTQVKAHYNLGMNIGGTAGAMMTFVKGG